MRLELDLDRWERGELTAHELAALHGHEEVEGIIALHARLEDIGAIAAPDPDASWQGLRWRLPTRRPRGRRARILALAAALAVGLASLGYAAERILRPQSRPPAVDLRNPTPRTVQPSMAPHDSHGLPWSPGGQDEPGGGEPRGGGNAPRGSETGKGRSGMGGGGSREESEGSDLDEDEEDGDDDAEDEDERDDEDDDLDPPDEDDVYEDESDDAQEED